jgi:Nuclease-related domain
LYAVVGPEPQGAGELDLPDREQPDGYLQLAQALSRAGGQTLAIDTPSSQDLQQLSTAELRAERDRLRHQLDQAPRDRSRELARATAHCKQAEQARAAQQPSADRQPNGMLRWLRRGHDQSDQVPDGLAVATQQVNRAHDRERQLRQHQQRRDGWLEANAHLGPQYRQVVRALAWQRRATGLAIEAERPSYALEALGPVPESTRGRRAWRQAAAEIEQYRHSYKITDLDRALGPEPHDPAQQADRQRAGMAIERVRAKQRAADRSRDTQPTSERPNQPRSREQRGRHRRGPAGGGGAGAGQRGPAGRLSPGDLAADAGERVGRLDPDPALASGCHPRHGCRRGSSWQPAGAPAGARPRRAGGCGGWLGAAIPAQPGRHRLAAGERRTARRLAALERHGWAVLHDLAVPGSQANIDHLVIGPGGVFMIDSKQYRGRLQLDPSGRLWHFRHPLAPTLGAVSWEADQAARVLPDPGVAVVPIVAVHGARVPCGKVVVEGVPVVSARRVPSMLRALPAVLGPQRVAALAEQAWIRLQAAA